METISIQLNSFVKIQILCTKPNWQVLFFYCLKVICLALTKQTYIQTIQVENLDRKKMLFGQPILILNITTIPIVKSVEILRQCIGLG